ncbi:MAG: translocation/assembly module TamB domain-containing protein [Micropepsaceae bacterium]
MRVLKRVGIGVAMLGAALVIVLVLLMAGVFRQSAAKLGFWAAGSAAGYVFSCEEFEGNILSSSTCRGFTATDDLGPFFRAQLIEFGWQFLPVLTGRLNIDHLRIANAELNREPQGEDNGDASSLPDWPGLSIALGEFTLQRLVVSLPGAPTVCLNGGGRGEIAEPVLILDMQFARCAGEGTGRVLINVDNGQLDINVRAMDDGDLASLILGWDGAGATNIRLVSAGPLEAFSGTLDAQIDNGGTASLEIGTIAAANIDARAIGITGAFAFDVGRAPDWAPAMDGSISARVTFGEQGNLRLDDGVLLWGNAEIGFDLLRSGAGALTGQLTAQVGPYDGAVAFQSAQMSLNLQGDGNLQTVTGNYALEDFCVQEICAAALDGELEITNENSTLAVVTQGTAQSLSATEILIELLGQELNFDFAGTYALDDERLDLEGSLQGAQSALGFSAQMSTANGIAGSASGRIDIEENADIGGIVLPAAISLSAEIEEFASDGSISGALGVASDIVDAAGSFALSEDKTLDVVVETVRTDPVLLSQMSSVNFAAAPFIRAVATGTSTLPILSAEASLPALGIGSFALNEAEWTLNMRRFETGWVGESAFASQSSGGIIDLNAGINWPDDAALEIDIAQSNFADASIAGNFTAPPGDVPVAGVIQLTGNVLSPLGQYLDQPAASTGAVEIMLETRGDFQIVTVDLELEDVSIGEQLSGATLRGDLTYDIAASHAETALKLSEAENTLDLAARADFGDETLILVTRLEGDWADTPIRLLEPASLHRTAMATTLMGAEFAIADGRAVISGSQSGNDIEAQITLSAIPVEPIMELQGYPDAQGEIHASLNVRLTSNISQAQIAFSLDDFALTEIAPDLVPTDLSLTGSWNGIELSIDGALSGLDETPTMFSASLPLARDAEGYGVVIDDDAPISGMFEGSARAEHFFALLPIAEHSLSGLILASFHLEGTPAAPRFSGQARLQNGIYESLELGTRLEGVELTLDAAAANTFVFEANANDGGEGRLTADGRLSFDENTRLFGDANITITDAHVLQRDEYSAHGSGEFNFDLPQDETASITGMFRTSEVRVDLGQPLPPGVEEIDVVEINRPAELGALASDDNLQRDDFISTATLDIEVTMPNNVRAEGYGVNTEWQGNITIAGTVGTPVIGGEITLVRGFAEFLGRQFTLEEGSVVPDADEAGNARVAITGSYTQDDLTVEINIAGPAASPEIEWSSVPALPRDEIISRLYFGRSSPQLTAYEAIQLAQLSASLAGFGSTGGVLGFARSVVGLDVLRIEPPESGDISNPTVTVGKYVTERVYVGARRDADTSSSSVEVEVNITPNISAEVETGTDDTQAAGINWHWNY